MSQEAKQDTGLVRRGLFLLVLIGGLVSVVLWIIFQRPAQPTPTARTYPEPHLVSLATADLGFPASLSWPALGMLTESLPSSPGWEVRYNAAASLGRLGAAEVPWAILAEMLDEDQQMRNFRVRLDSGEIVADEAAARRTVINALKAVKQWHDKQSKAVDVSADHSRVRAAVERLAGSPIVEVQKQAQETRTAIQAKAP